MPILFMVAEHDELVPPQMSDVLFKKAVNSEKKTTVS
jgi:esterase/lipase